ncbi:hypothetical protein [Acinetobacter amyesii]|uniref:hypothetical protein n=1 Tax=Acinetobacter amyesii TaxID=2942470 RepID=UPI0020BDB380|nr:hypothetical protein [Acinetobacter amyesii]MCL6231125.1 hypothetical protein [Acinetobacter amyesii]
MKEYDLIMVSMTLSNGVGSLRSKALYDYLSLKGLNVCVVEKESTNLIWIFSIIKNIYNNKAKKLYVSCGPFILLPVLILLALIFRKKLIVDFRDPWSLNLLNNYGRGGKVNKLKYLLSLMLEKVTYFFCYKFIVCTKGMYYEYSKIFKCNKKIKIIENGFNFDCFLSENLNVINNDEILKFICVGKFAEYDFDKAVEILKEIKKRARLFNVVFVGCDFDLNKEAVSLAEIDENVSFKNKMCYQDVITYLRDFNVGLFIVRDENIEYGTKIFDYIGSGLSVYSIINEESILYLEFNEYFYKFDSNDILSGTLDRGKWNRSNLFNKFEGILF